VTIFAQEREVFNKSRGYFSFWKLFSSIRDGLGLVEPKEREKIKQMP
jgi:hypothetical protein